MNDLEGCTADADLALQINPKLANSWLLKGRVSLQKGEKQKACEFWSKAGELGKTEAYEFISKNCNN